jgi:hypothetical protein
VKYPKLPNAVSARGASMGRPSVIEEELDSIKFRLYKMPMSGDYDSGGAYWGMGRNSEPMWHAFGDGAEFKNELFVRAKSREDAKTQVCIVFPHATFFR